MTDWPDLAQRGMWEDAFTAEQIEWMAGYKLNRVDCEVRLGMTEGGRGMVVRLPVKGPEVIDRADYPTFYWQRGVRCAPIILHFDLLERTGIYERYPELRGQGTPAGARLVAPCACRPEFARVLADWIDSLASRPHVDEVAIWLSEEKTQCGCDECRAVGQHPMEVRAVIRAWPTATGRSSWRGARVNRPWWRRPWSSAVTWPWSAPSKCARFRPVIERNNLLRTPTTCSLKDHSSDFEQGFA